MTKAARAAVDIENLLDRPFGAWRLMVFLLCGLVMAVEGIDMRRLHAARALGAGRDRARLFDPLMIAGLAILAVRLAQRA